MLEYLSVMLENKINKTLFKIEGQCFIVLRVFSRNALDKLQINVLQSYAFSVAVVGWKVNSLSNNVACPMQLAGLFIYFC